MKRLDYDLRLMNIGSRIKDGGRLFVSDLGLTLLNKDKIAPLSVKMGARRINGIDNVGLTIASGKNPWKMAPYRELVKPFIPTIEENGARLRWGNFTLRHYALSKDQITHATDIIQELSTSISGVVIYPRQVAGCEPQIILKEEEKAEKLRKRFGSRANIEPWNIREVSSSAFFHEAGMMVVVFREDKVPIPPTTDVTIDTNANVWNITGVIESYDIHGRRNRVNVDKGLGIEVLCEELDIPVESITVLGDGINDMPSFQLPGLKDVWFVGNDMRVHSQIPEDKNVTLLANPEDVGFALQETAEQLSRRQKRVPVAQLSY